MVSKMVKGEGQLREAVPWHGRGPFWELVATKLLSLDQTLRTSMCETVDKTTPGGSRQVRAVFWDLPGGDV